jgi:hypothetical protein
VKHCGAVQSRLTLAVGAHTPENPKNRFIKPVAFKLGLVASPHGETPFRDWAGIGRPACQATPRVWSPRRRPTTDESNSSFNLARAVNRWNGSFNRPRHALSVIQVLTRDCATGAAPPCPAAFQRRGVIVANRPHQRLRQRIDVEQGKIQAWRYAEPNKSMGGSCRRNRHQRS